MLISYLVWLINESVYPSPYMLVSFILVSLYVFLTPLAIFWVIFFMSLFLIKLLASKGFLGELFLEDFLEDF